MESQLPQLLNDDADWLGAGRIPSLDGIRAIAVVFVLLAHVHQTRGFPKLPLLHAVGSIGSLGVEVFFVLSGFLITILMLREIDRTRRLDLYSFYRRRVLRIFPAYVALLLVVALLQFVQLAAVTSPDWIAAATYTMNFQRHPAWEVGHAWSLSIEEHFYVVWPPLVVCLPPRFRVRALTACLVACFVARWIVLLGWPALTPMAELWTFTRLDSIASGCLLAVLAQQQTWRNRLDKLSAQWLGAVLILMLSLVLSRLSGKWSVGIAYSLNAACIVVLIWTGAQKAPGWLNHSLVAAIGVGSYSLYLWQQLFLNPHREMWVTAFPQNLILAGLTAWISYQFIESPFLRLKERKYAPDMVQASSDSLASG